jgi:hypothetical protein
MSRRTGTESQKSWALSQQVHIDFIDAKLNHMFMACTDPGV